MHMISSGDAPATKISPLERQLLNLIPPDAAVVLELGCGEGSLGAHYKKRNPVGRYVGVAQNAPAAVIAAKRLDQVINTIPATISLPEAGFGPGSVDCLLIYGPALAADKPAQRLRELLRSLSPQGVALFMIANSRHRIGGGGRYSWSLQQLRTVCKRAGCKAVEVFPVGGRPRQNASGGRPGAPSRGTAPQFFIARIPVTPPRKRLLIQSMTLPPTAACNDKRIHEPDTCLRTVPGVRAVSMDMRHIRLVKTAAGESPVFVWQRPVMTRPKTLPRLKRLLAEGYLVIVEFDDDPRRWQPIVDHDFLTFRGVHGVQTSTEALAGFLRQYNPHVAVFPNQMLELSEKKIYEADTVVRLFFGALNREDDWRPILPVLNRVLKEQRGNVHVTVVHDQGFFDALDTRHKSFYSLCAYPEYLTHLKNSDIGLLPLADTEFNRYKSDLKFIECAAHEVVALASPTVYASTLVDGAMGMLFHDADEFERKLRLLIKDAGMRRRIAEHARSWVAQNRMLGRHFRRRHEWYMQMLERLPQLNRELRERMPELFE